MIRLKSIKIKGFKDPTYEKELNFSTEPISVIYGENGSGKTTLLKILFAVLSKNSKILQHENVHTVIIIYYSGKTEKTLTVKRNNDNTIDWGDNLELYNSSSILFGVHRGVISESRINLHMDKNRLFMLVDELIQILNNPKNRISPRYIEEIMYLKEKALSRHNKVNFDELFYFAETIRLRPELRHNSEIMERVNMISKEIEYFAFNRTYQNEKSSFLRKLNSQAHLSTDFVKIKDIQNAIVTEYNKGQTIISRKIQSAFFETIEKAVEIDEKDEEFLLPDDFEERIETNKDFILKAIPTENSSLTKRIKKYLKTKDSSLTDNSKIFRSMLLNIIESAEEPNPTLEAISKLIEIFNEHLYDDKKLIVDEEKAYIKLKNNKFHELSELSSGERNLLSILTLFLIIGKERNFLMIDEPEISFNIKWQRDFLPLLSRINSNAQIIVASHSPSIAHNNSKYLIELK